ncbi:MAG: 16S rRNA (guanine(527)-N(7))-methyltransferase RsmG [Ruminococcaceae bacterium]|nr:16S rRNA (guanine(527)-N(7))-methyltransferase RsmG [Oscillospiraceae bacterium]MBO5040998.1 16S rRNA (guanine(527)-N(7))-methyltransferase RsmG [Clostridia bacterium]
MYSEKIKAALKDNGVSVNNPQAKLLSDYLTELLETNKTTNLTAIKDPDEAIIKHIADCAVCINDIPQGADLLDVGSGAGLPAFPFAILRPDISVTALDSTGKKIEFIKSTAEKLGIGNLKTISARAETLANNRSYRQRYTVVSARAVARLNVLSELCLPFLKVGGVFLSMKSRLADEELSEALSGIGTLGGKPREVKKFTLVGGENEERCLIIIDKRRDTPPQFPRAYARISSKPL